MENEKSKQDTEVNQEVPTGNNGPDGTAPDSETQSGAASEAGDRTSPEGSRAPNEPAEGE